MAEPDQPLDVGNGLICASFALGGEWLSLATVDPDLGFVELTGMPPFDEAWRGDPDAVRRYRSWMRQADHAFLRVDAAPATVTTQQEAPRATRQLTQHVVIQAPPSGHPADIRIRLRGRLARPAYAEVRTEVDPPRWQTGPTRLEVGEGALSVLGEGPPVLVQACLGAVAGGSPADWSDRGVSWRVLSGRMPAAEARIEWPEGASWVGIDIACAFDLPVAPGPVRPTPWPDRRLRADRSTIKGPAVAPPGGPSGRADSAAPRAGPPRRGVRTLQSASRGVRSRLHGAARG